MRNKLYHLAVRFIIVMLLGCTAAFGQDSTKSDYWISTSGHYGFIIAHHSNMAYLIRKHIGGFEFDYIQPTHGNKLWQREYSDPEFGFCFFQCFLGNPQQLGNISGVYPYFNFHLNNGRRFKLFLRFGAGAAYLSKRFNRVTDHKNNAIGTHFNALLNLRFNSNFRLSDNLRLEAGVGMTHSSNGAIKMPNLGLNIPTINLGLSYHIGTKPQNIHDTIPPVNKRFINTFILAGGVAAIEPPGSPTYHACTFSWNIHRVVTYKSHIGGGIDIFYNPANIEKMKEDSVFITHDYEDIQPGIKFSYELTIDKLSIPMEMGAYLYTKYTGNGYIYNRFGLRYAFSNHLVANLSLLTHFAKADYVEWGIGYWL